MTTSTVTVYTAAEAAQILRCDRETVYRWVRMGQLKSCDRGGRRAHLFTQEHIDEFLNGPKAEAAPKPLAKTTRNPNRRYAS